MQEGTNGWKGRNAALAELVHIYLVNLPKQGPEGSTGAAAKKAVDRLQAIRDLAVDVFPVVRGAVLLLPSAGLAFGGALCLGWILRA